MLENIKNSCIFCLNTGIVIIIQQEICITLNLITQIYWNWWTIKSSLCYNNFIEFYFRMLIKLEKQKFVQYSRHYNLHRLYTYLLLINHKIFNKLWLNSLASVQLHDWSLGNPTMYEYEILHNQTALKITSYLFLAFLERLSSIIIY